MCSSFQDGHVGILGIRYTNDCSELWVGFKSGLTQRVWQLGLGLQDPGWVQNKRVAWAHLPIGSPPWEVVRVRVRSHIERSQLRWPMHLYGLSPLEGDVGVSQA